VTGADLSRVFLSLLKSCASRIVLIPDQTVGTDDARIEFD
jgi:hypothetical protein